MRTVIRDVLEVTDEKVVAIKVYDDGFETRTEVIHALADKGREFFNTLDFEFTNKGEIGDNYQRKTLTVLNVIKHLIGEASYISLMTSDAISYMKLLSVLEREIELTWADLGSDDL